MNSPDSTVVQELVRRLSRLTSMPTGDLLDSIGSRRLDALGKRVRTVSEEQSLPLEVLGFDASGTAAWRAETGFALHSWSTGRIDQSTLQWAAAVAASGGQGRMSLLVSAPALVVFEGRLIQVEGRVSIEATGEFVELVWRDGSASFARAARTWDAGASRSHRWIPHGVEGFAPNWVSRTDLALTATGAFPWPDLQATNDAAPAPCSLVGAIDLLSRATPLQANWVKGALRGLLVTRSGLTPAYVASDSRSIGMLAIAPPECLFHCADLLTQEAARQHLMALLGLISLNEDAVHETWFSPISRSYVSTMRLLSEAHSHANTLLMYDGLRATTQLPPSAELRAMTRKAILRDVCLPSLRKSRTLTDAGRMMIGELCGVCQ